MIPPITITATARDLTRAQDGQFIVTVEYWDNHGKTLSRQDHTVQSSEELTPIVETTLATLLASEEEAYARIDVVDKVLGRVTNENARAVVGKTVSAGQEGT